VHNNRWCLRIGPWVLASVFFVAGISKGLNPQSTAKAIGTLSGGVIPDWSVAGLVFVEILLAGWLAFGFLPRAALLATIILLLSFSLALGALLVVSPTSPCGCGLPAFSGNTTVDNSIGIARNVLLVFIAALAWPARHS